MRAILTYHSVDESGSPISTPASVFRHQVAWLATRGPRVVPLTELLREPAAEPAVALTFDDAFANFAETAWPVLRDHGLPATLFVPTACVGGTNAWGGTSARGIPTLPLLDWDALGHLAEAGVQLGSHTRTHPRLALLPQEQVREELERSAEELHARTGYRPLGLAYPYGSCDPAVVALAATLYSYAVTVELRVLGPAVQAHRLPRLDMFYLRERGLLEAWGTHRLDLYLRARAAIRRGRAILATGSVR